MVYTRVQVPEACGQDFSAGDFVFAALVFRQFRIS
jgi:hypothetical protein